MKFLLDTCAFLWLSDRTDCLSAKVFELVSDAENELFVHQATTAPASQVPFDPGVSTGLLGWGIHWVGVTPLGDWGN